jgi:hypothetical protein
MRKPGALAGTMLLGMASTWGATDVAPAPADFKLIVSTYGLGKEPVETFELVVRKGHAYHFISGPSLEVILYDPSTARLELIDLDRKKRSEVTLKKLDAFQARLHDTIAVACAKRELQGGKANLVAAAMSRELIDPKFKATYDEPRHHLKLANTAVEVDAEGEPEPDRARLSLIAGTLIALVKLEALRAPQGIPPFSRLETFKALMDDHRLRPTEIAIVYRLAGPPKKLRWSYRFKPALTEREIEALKRVDAMMERCAFARFEQYERRADDGPNP